MNRRCALYWVVAFAAAVVSAVAYYRGGIGGIDGLFLVIGLAAALLGIQAHESTGMRS